MFDGRCYLNKYIRKKLRDLGDETTRRTVSKDLKKLQLEDDVKAVSDREGGSVS